MHTVWRVSTDITLINIFPMLVWYWPVLQMMTFLVVLKWIAVRCLPRIYHKHTFLQSSISAAYFICCCTYQTSSQRPCGHFILIGYIPLNYCLWKYLSVSIKNSENNNILLCAGWSSEGAWDSLRIAVNEGPLFSLSTSTEALWKWCWVSRDTNLFLSLVLQSHAVQYLPQLRFIYLIYRQEGMAPWVWNLFIHMWKDIHP